MRRAALFAGLVVLLAIGGSAAVPGQAGGDRALALARAEAEAAGQRLQALETKAARAVGEADRLRAETAAAAAAIDDSEARIGEAEATLKLARARVTEAEARLARRRAPLAALLAGLATMGRQPPILSLADGSSVDELVRVRALLSSTMPLIQARSAALQADLGERRRLAVGAVAARASFTRQRALLAERQRRFADLETRGIARAEMLQSDALGAGDRVLASGEALDRAGNEAVQRRTGRATAEDLRRLGLAPPRPVRGDSALPTADFGYTIPVDAALVEGLGSVSAAGIASRGLRFDSLRGAVVTVPADGRIAFAAPFRGQDGVVIIDHGGGMVSLLLGVASALPRGETVRRGQPLGRALGPVTVELRRDGRPISPAFIAASSVALSNGGNSR